MRQDTFRFVVLQLVVLSSSTFREVGIAVLKKKSFSISLINAAGGEIRTHDVFFPKNIDFLWLLQFEDQSFKFWNLEKVSTCWEQFQWSANKVLSFQIFFWAQARINESSKSGKDQSFYFLPSTNFDIGGCRVVINVSSWILTSQSFLFNFHHFYHVQL